MGTCNPKFLPGDDHTAVCNADVVGARFVSIHPGVNAVDGLAQIRNTAAAARAYGVAAQDQVAGQTVGLFRAGVLEVEAGAALAHGQGVEAGAGGTAVVLAAGVRLGTVVADAANGTKALIALELGA